MSKITKKGTKSYSFKVGSETIEFPTLAFLTKESISKTINKEDVLLLKTIPGSKPERSYYDLFPDLSAEQMQEIASFFEKDKAKKTEAMSELSMFPEDKMNHFIDLLELKNICTKGVFFITTGTSDRLMKGREEAKFSKMGEDLISCLDDPSVEFVVMYLNLNLPSTGLTSMLKGFVLSHRNSIIIDKQNSKIIRFEPMGAMPKAHENLTIAEIHQKIFEYLSAGGDTELKKHMDYIKKFEYLDTNRFDIFSCPFISAPQLGNIFCQTYSIYGALLYIINSDIFNKTPSSLFVALGDINKIMLMWYLAVMTIDKKSVALSRVNSSNAKNKKSAKATIPGSQKLNKTKKRKSTSKNSSAVSLSFSSNSNK
jgi:hypothetical protein